MSRELLKRAKTVLSLINMNSDTKSGESVNLYRLIEAELAKPETKQLSEEKLKQMWHNHEDDYVDYYMYFAIAREVEKEHEIGDL